jgi:hypothetical protein
MFCLEGVLGAGPRSAQWIQALILNDRFDDSAFHDSAFDDSAHASCPNAPFNALGIQSTAVAARGTQSINPSITKDSAYQTRNI